MTTTKQDDGSYLTDPTKVRGLAIWILTSDSYYAVTARTALGLSQQKTDTPSDALLKMAYGYLFDPATNISNLIRASKI